MEQNMNDTLTERLERFVWDKLFDDRTGMFYNYLADGASRASDGLPSPDLISRMIPNPGGYGTGMEDCMLNAGIMMDAVLSQYEAVGDPALGQKAACIWRGMKLCASVSPQSGFLPRGVSPDDCMSHYIDTSRDQYTNWIYGAFRFYASPLCEEEQRESIRRCLRAMAEKFEREVTAENDWSFLREDGQIGIVGKMWGELWPHEYLRLPMLYLLTWKATGDPHYRDLYMHYRDEAIDKTLQFVPGTGATYVGVQLQFSMLLVTELDDDVSVRTRLYPLMHAMADAYEALSVRCAEQLMTPQGKEWLEIPYASWEKSRFRYAGCVGGLGYFVPEPSDFREHESYYPLRAVGEGIMIAASCPGHRVSDDALDRLCRMAAFVDYDRHRTCAPIALLGGYWKTMANRSS